MKKQFLVAIAIAAVGCQQIYRIDDQVDLKIKSDQQDEYQEEAYPIGQQEEQYFEQTKTQQK